MHFTSIDAAAGSKDVANEHLRELLETLDGGDAFIDERIDATDRHAIATAIRSYDRAFVDEFGAEHDSFRLIGQDNIRRYLPVGELRLRIHAEDSAFDIFARAAAAQAAGARITVSYPPDGIVPAIEALEHATERWGGAIEFVEETDETLATVVRTGLTDRVRYAGRDRVPEDVLRAIGETGIYIARAPVLGEGRIELLWYLKEQSLCFDYHRYGTLGDRALEERRATL